MCYIIYFIGMMTFEAFNHFLLYHTLIQFNEQKRMERICFSEACEEAPKSAKEEAKEVRYSGIALDLEILNQSKL